jgi:hypothetical protein
LKKNNRKELKAVVRRDGAENRKERITAIARSIHASLFQSKEAGFIPLKKTVALQMLEHGLTKEKVMEYMFLLQEAEQLEIDIDGDQIRKALV